LGVQTRAIEGAYAVEYMLAGEQVSRLFVKDLRMRVGGAALRSGGIADVETKEQYRRRGYMRQVMERAVALMRQKGYDISALFGISDFYPRWGYAPVFPETRIIMAPKDAAGVRSVYPLRRLGRPELDLTLELYRRNNALRTGSIVRRRDRWPGFRHGSRYRWPINVYGAFDARGRLMGYAVLDRSPAEAIVCEVGYRSEEVFGSLLAIAARQARRVRAEQIQVLAPADHPFAEFCQQLGCRLMIRYNRNGGAMARIINLESCFTRLAPELARRLKSSRCDWRGKLAIKSDIGEVTLRIQKSTVNCEEGGAADARLDISQALLTQLIFGYRRAAEALRAGGASLRGAPVELIEALFPRGCAYVWRPDHF
jgi:predicted acetyltransferase